MGVLLLRPEDHYGLLGFADGVRLMQSGFNDIAESPIKLSNPRTRTNTAEGFRMSVHQGVNPSQHSACTSGRGERVKVLTGGQQKYIGRGRPVFTLFDTETADLLMIMVGEPRAKGYEDTFCLAGFQTACTAMVGTLALARPDASRVGVLGSGGQAMMHLAALAETRQISGVRVYSPTDSKREAFAQKMSAKLGIAVEAVGSTNEVLSFAEILLICTNANYPVLDGTKLVSGTHITSIVHSNKEMQQSGVIEHMRQEVDDETLRRAELIVTASWAQEELDEPEVLIGSLRRGVIRREKVFDIRDLLRGGCDLPGVHSRGGITFFKNPGAWGIGIAALMRGYHDRARALGAGIDLGIDGQELLY